MKRLLLILTVLMSVCVLPCRAQESTSLYLMVINKESTDTTFFKVSDYPVVKTSAETSEFSVSLSETTVMYFPMKNCIYKIARLGDSTVDPVTDAIDEPIALSHTINGGKAIFRGLRPGSSVYVYSIDGQQISNVKADSSGCATIDYSILPEGKIYILRSENTSIKIIK